MPPHTTTPDRAPEAVPVTPTGTTAPPVVEAPKVTTDHTPVLHVEDNLPAPQGAVPTALHKSALATQRDNAEALFKFLDGTHHSCYNSTNSKTDFGV